MDPAQRPESTSTNSAGTRGDAARGALGRYLENLVGQPLAMRTRQAYAAQVSAYIAWLAERPDSDGALREPRARDFAARDFKRHLKLERGLGAELGEPRAGSLLRGSAASPLPSVENG